MSHPKTPDKKRLFLFGWDAADWKVIHPLLDAGEMPHLERLINRGTMGDITTLRPVLSPMLWNSIGTGKRADKHGILGFSMVDEKAGRVVPSLSTSRKCKALWNITSQNNLKTNVIGWFAGHPAEPINGVNITEMLSKGVPKSPEDEWKIPPGTIHPPELEEKAQDWCLHPQELDSDVLRHFVPNIAEIDQKKDGRIYALAKLLSEAFTTHAATVHALEHEDWDFMASYYISIDHFAHTFMHLHPPKMEHVGEKEFELYQDVINSAYRLHDLFLGRIMAAIDDDTYFMLVSDHGFVSDHERPEGNPDVPAGPAEWHRDHGIFVLAGPGIKQDHRIHGATLLDVTPTVLHALGLPIGRDMEGKVLTDCWQEEQTIDQIDSWEEVEGDDGSHTQDYGAMDLGEQDALMQHFIDLGYVDKPSDDNDLNLTRTRLEQNWHLAQVHLEKGDLKTALPMLEDAYENASQVFRRMQALKAAASPNTPPTPTPHGVAPNRPDIAMALTNCLISSGNTTRAREVLETFLAHQNQSQQPSRVQLRALVLGGKMNLAEGNPRKALEKFTEAKTLLGLRAPSIAFELGECYRKLKRPKKALECYQEVLEWNGTHTAAASRMASILGRAGKYEDAAEFALQAVTANFNFTRGHYQLGRILSQIEGQEERAELALKTALQQAPGYWQAHRALAGIYRTKDQEELAQKHEESAEKLIDQQTEEKRKIERDNIAQLAAFTQKHEEDPDEDYFIEPTRVGREFTIVSGLPRSGTSLMMGMIAAGGLTPMTDGTRRADQDNPTGYFEWEDVKRLQSRPGLIEQAHGKVLKVVSPHLKSLPAYHNYKIIFMMRDLEEVARSQQKLKENLGNADVPAATSEDHAEQIKKLQKHRDQVLWGLHHLDRLEVLEVNFADLIADPETHAQEVAEFLERKMDTKAMANFVNPDLYRQKVDGSNS